MSLLYWTKGGYTKEVIEHNLNLNLKEKKDLRSCRIDVALKIPENTHS